MNYGNMRMFPYLQELTKLSTKCPRRGFYSISCDFAITSSFKKINR